LLLQRFSFNLSPIFFHGVPRVRRFLLAAGLVALSVCSFAAKPPTSESIRVAVDLTDAPRNIFHSSLTVPATAGEMTLVYPKWIPGNHRPSGPIANVTGLHFKAGNQDLAWYRDPVEMYSFHVTVPPGVREIQATFDLISVDSAGGGGSAASSNLLDLNWNQVVLYPDGAASDAVEFVPSVRLPAGWKYGTALTAARAEGDEVAFNPVSLTMLVDSPLIAGAHYRQVELMPAGEIPAHVMDMVAESDADLEMTPADIAAYRKLVVEADALFGAHHYLRYHFLYTLSDAVGHHGLEHHQSSDNSVPGRTLLDPNKHLLEAGLIPHEFTHSWNGKFRRPAGLATKNYQAPMIGDLLWVYEGLTDYLGQVLAVRSGLWTAEQYREELASTAAILDHRAGRSWRPLEDTGVSVQMLRMQAARWENWRRGLDYYPEGDLIWLEVDTIIRKQTQGRRSLDDFCRRFHGGESGPPKVVPYTFEDVVRELNAVAPYDWAALLKERVKATSTHAPMGGIEEGGWRLVYNDRPNAFLKARAAEYKMTSLAYSLGFSVAKDGQFIDVIPDSPAYQAGLGPGMKLIAVNGRAWSPVVLTQALHSAHASHEPIEVIAETGEFFKTYRIPYFEGEKIPHLERVDGQPDALSDILKPKTGPPGKP
jgi:predicted metalloprotease with PDZ domain